MLMTLGTIAGDLYSHINAINMTKIVEIFGWFILVLVLTFFSMFVDRFFSWERAPNDALTEQKHWFWGIILPDIFGIALFAFYRYSLG